MLTNLGKTATVWNSELGEFIDSRHAHLAAVLHDYKPTLSLVYIPKKDRSIGEDKPWAILDDHPRLGQHIIRYMTELEMNDPAAILAWIFDGDLDKHRTNDIAARIEHHEQARQLLALKKEEEDLEDRLDKLTFLASGGRDKLHSIRLRKGERIERG